ncbi:MAG: HNH endonuclease signature motif containing protein [bacterium]|nr:HNH endonuclease signature motif containing protein [bacterium]
MKPIDRTLRYPDLMSASLDHVVPLSKGGANSAENFQASHLSCNISIGNRKTEGELRPAPVWLGVEYCSVSQAADYLGIPVGRLKKLADKGLVPTMPREKHQTYRIPIDFVEEAFTTGTPEELFVDPRSKPKITHRDLTCEFCKKTVSVPIGLKSRRRFCSEECYKSSLRERKRETNRKNPRRKTPVPRRKTPVIRYCIICGSKNPVSKDGSRSNSLCGKKECKAEHNHRKRMNMRSKEESHPKCKYCDKNFKQRERGGGQPRKYCSDDCRKLAARERARKHHYKNRKSFRHFTCEVCEKRMTVPTGRDQKTKYCSDECKKVKRAERRKTKTESNVLPQV